MKDEFAYALETTLDAKLMRTPPLPDMGEVLRRGRQRRRRRRALAATSLMAVAASGVALPNLDRWSQPGERERTSIAAGVERIGRMSVPRAAHAATLLENGRVLISGGFSGDSEIYYDSAELFDPTTRTFLPIGVMTTPRTDHASVLLGDGTVLIAGGWGNRFLATAELFDPTTGRFTETGSMNTSRDAFSATRLQDGRVLVVGGFRDSYDTFNRSAEVYDPSTGRFTAVGSLRRARAAHTATLLPNGHVVVAGGLGPDGVLRSIEVFNPTTERFTSAGRMVAARQKHGAALLDNGKILFAGGADFGDFQGRLSSAEDYDPKTGASRSVGSMSATRFKIPSPINLPSSRSILVVGGADVADVYRERLQRFRPVDGVFEGAHFFPTATLLQDGTVLVAGGYDEQITATDGAWLFSP